MLRILFEVLVAVNLLQIVAQDLWIVVFQTALLLPRLGAWPDDHEREALATSFRVVAVPALADGVGG